MDESALRDQIIQQYFNLKRIKEAVDKDKEIDYQERIFKVRMHYMDIVVEELEKKK